MEIYTQCLEKKKNNRESSDKIYGFMLVTKTSPIFIRNPKLDLAHASSLA